MKKLLFFAFASLFIMVGCNQLKPVKTIKNLKAGIIGETTASAKYAAFAEKARAEGLDTIAKLFDAASKSEGVHAVNHKKVLEGMNEKMEEFTPKFEVKTTAENLQKAIEGETYESTTMYPQFLVDAKAEKVDKAEKSFNWAADTELKHEQYYKNALAALQTNTENTLAFEYAICPVCGNTYDKKSFEAKCKFCGTKQENFIMI